MNKDIDSVGIGDVVRLLFQPVSGGSVSSIDRAIFLKKIIDEVLTCYYEQIPVFDNESSREKYFEIHSVLCKVIGHSINYFFNEEDFPKVFWLTMRDIEVFSGMRGKREDDIKAVTQKTSRDER